MTETAYPVDAGIIRCICGFDHDDTFTIQCEQCNVWQHAACVGIESEKAVPDIYLCDRCGHKKLDVEAAVELQTKFLRKKKRHGTKRVPESPPESEPPRRRGKKKRVITSTGGNILSAENTKDAVAACFVTCEQSVFSVEAQQVLKSISETDISRSYTLDEFDRSKPVPLSIQRNSLVYGPCGFKVIANQSITRGKLVCELKGEVLTLDEYVTQPWNQYGLWQCPKPGVLRVSGLPLLVDGRCIGTDLSLVRRSSLPNILIEPFLVNHELRFGAFARTSIRAGQELTISWMWDEHFPLNQDTKVTQFSALMDSLSKEERAVVCNSLKELKSAGLIDTFSDCFAQTPSKTALAVPPKKSEEKKAMPLGRSVLKQHLLSLAARTTNEVTKPLDSIYEQDIWVLPKLEVEQKPEQEPRKKKLSLAEYKKKRPPMSVTPAGV